MNLANQLTLCRILLIPLLVVVFYLPFDWRFPLAALIYTLAGITDALDGYIARKYQQTTPFGAFLDPVADKLIVAVALALLIELHASALFTLPAAVIIGREIVVSALREWMAELGKRANIAVSSLGKIKTTFQITAIVILLLFDPSKFYYMKWLGYVTLYIAAILTLWSMLLYLRAAWPNFKLGDAANSPPDDENNEQQD